MFLGADVQMALYGKLNTVPPEKAKWVVRTAFSLQSPDQERILAVMEEIEASGLQQPEPAQVLPFVNENQVRLVTWMAVKGRTSNGEKS